LPRHRFFCSGEYMIFNQKSGSARAGLLACFLLAVVPGAVRLRAMTDEEIQRELLYFEGLNALGLYDYASAVLDRIPPDPRVKSYRIQSLIIKREFDEAKAMIAKEPNQDAQETWAMKLALGDGYYAWGMYTEAKAVYQNFFKRYESGPPEELRRFYLDSAYKYAQMLRLTGDNKGAAQAYRIGLKGKPPRHIERQFQSELAELLVKMGAESDKPEERANYFREAREICDKILWVQDVWFGKAIVMLAHMLMVEGKTDEAMKLIEDYKGELTAIDRALKEESEETGENLTRLSPMAECRYLMGVILQEEAVKALDTSGDARKALELLGGKKDAGGRELPGALQHFVNVFIRYPTTPWAADAGRRAREIEDILRRRLRRRPQWQATAEQWDKVEKAQFMEARALFGQNQFEQAAEAYVNALNLFPESANSLSGLGDLANCYIELDHPIYADMVVGHIAERFKERRKNDLATRAGDQVLRIAALYEERGKKDSQEQTYRVFYENFRKHPRTAALLYKAGEDRFEAEDIEGALQYFKRVAEEHKDSPLSYNAMSRIAACHEARGEMLEYARALQAYIKRLETRDRPGHALIVAMYRQAGALRDLEPKYLPAALKRLDEVTARLAEKPGLYSDNAQEEKTNQQIREGAMFYRAAIYAKLPPPEGEPEIYNKVQAIKLYREIVEKYPDSRFAPAALSQEGVLWTVLDKPENAEEALRKLQQLYPDSNEAINALFLLGMSLLKIGERERAVRIFTRMFSDDAGTYNAYEILTAGGELLKAEEHEIALTAFDRALGMAKEPARIQAALLGKGKCQVELGNYAEGAKTLEDLFARFPNTVLTIEASFYLSKAYSEMGIREKDENKRFELFNLAVKAVKRVRRFDTSAKGRAMTNLRVGEIYELKMKAEQEMGSPEKAVEYRQEAIAAYQTILLFENPDVAEIRPFVEDAYHKCMPLMLEAEEWGDVIEDAERYFQIFPRGKHIQDIRKWHNKARAKQAAAGAVAPAPEGEPVEPAPETTEDNGDME